jgi:hypothetical protein
MSTVESFLIVAPYACMRQHITGEVNPTFLPASAQDLRDGSLDALVGIGDDQPDAAQDPSRQLAQELCPDRLSF